MTTRAKPKDQPGNRFLKPIEIKLVTRKVLEKIADDIYNPKTRRYLNLCDGTLQNGPDPVCEKRPMHCGLGELYFAVTGRQPEDDPRLDEDGVIQGIVKRSTIGDLEVEALKKVQKLDLPSFLKEELTDTVKHHEHDEPFREALSEIPDANDLAHTYLDRARRVAKAIRKAAALLPR